MTRGRKTKLTPELQERIVRYLRLGAYVETAAASTGISRDTFYEWLKKGARGLKPYAEFAQAVEQASADSETRDLATILQASKTQWQAAAWRLERRFPDKYGRHDRTKVEGKIDVEVGDDGLVGKLAQLIGGRDKSD